MEMKNPFAYFLALFLLLFSQTLTTATTLTASSDASTLEALITGLENRTLNIPVPPPNFGLTYEIGGPKLRITSCLMNTIAALKELALKNWGSDKIMDGTEYRLDNYPEVSITVTTSRRQRNIQARFVIWAICLGVIDMISKKQFEFAQFEISWDGQVLGWLQIVNQAAGVDLKTKTRQDNGTVGMENLTTTLLSANGTVGLEPFSITNIVTMDNADDPAEARLQVTMYPTGVTLAIYDVFVPIMSGLTDLAGHSSTQQTTGFISGLTGFQGWICIFEATPVRTSPPFMEFGWLIRAIARIPAYMLETGRFGEISMRIEVDGVLVGFGRLADGPVCGINASVLASLGVAES
ncbi:hypothetical protein IMSHALPRED_004432 [Imshaugia aleurites]|uniref:Uncharacterized protein n=1 Tax=Imshaugia aleurites TaxID=172621 RepID=A0A8H3F5C5_9LECA|nr:hypothetical protein IMSHALPRED_004432 [Imshaugia aleurites]